MKQTILIILSVLLAFQVVSAISVLSLDNIDFNSNNPDLAKSAFVLTGVENGGAQYAEYSLQNLNNALPSDYELTGTGTIKSKISNYKISYPIQQKGSVYTIEQVCQSNGDCDKFYFLESDADTFCRSLRPNSIQTKAVKDSGEIQWSCISFEQYGIYSDVTEGTHEFVDTFTVTANGQSDTITITQDDSVGYKEIGPSKHVVARVEGAITNFQDVPRPDIERDAFYDTKTNSWRVIQKLSTTEYNSLYSYSAIIDRYNDCRSGFLPGLFTNDNGWYSCIKGIQQHVTTGMKTQSYTGISVSGTTASNGKLILTPTTIYKYPLITLTIDAEWVGIFRPVGKPVIQSLIAPSRVIEGENNNIVSTVKNDATVSASFDYSWVCNGPFSVQTTGFTNFNEEETKQLQHFVTGQTSTGCSSGSCTLTVKDREAPSSFDTKTVALTVCEANQCDYEGQQRCSVNTIQECRNENGALVWHTITGCLNSCQIEGNFAVCSNTNDVVPICGDEICAQRERDESDQYYCLSDCSSPPPVCGDNVCDFRERSGGEYECLQPQGDCPIGSGTSTSAIVVIVLIVSAIIVAFAIGLRLKKEGYF